MNLIMLSHCCSEEYCPEMNLAIKEISQILVKELETPTNNYRKNIMLQYKMSEE